MNEFIYVAEDGSWGSAKGLLMIDAARWGDREHDDLGEAPDSDRVETAQAILRNRHEKPLRVVCMTEDEYDAFRRIVSKVF